MKLLAIVSLCVLLAHLVAGGHLDVPVAAVMGGAAVAGALLGPRFADRVSTQVLGQGFAVLVAFGVAGATLAGISV